MNKNLKFVVRSSRISKIFTDVRKAVDACRLDLVQPDSASLQKMRMIIDSQIEMAIGTDFMFFNNWNSVDGPGSDDNFTYVQLFVCEDA